MDFSNVTDFAEDHPVATFGIVIVGGLAILWLLGFFGSSGSSATASGTNLDQAYYSSIAAQQESANALSIAQTQANMYTGIAQIQANAATAENASNNAAAVTISGQQQTTQQLANNETYWNNQGAITAGNLQYSEYLNMVGANNSAVLAGAPAHALIGFSPPSPPVPNFGV